MKVNWLYALLGISALTTDAQIRATLLKNDNASILETTDSPSPFKFEEDIEAWGCGNCPCLCYYYPCKAGNCCTEEAANDKHCTKCDVETGECTACKKEFSLDNDNNCVENKGCTHKKNGYCVHCKKGETLDPKTLQCKPSNHI